MPVVDNVKKRSRNHMMNDSMPVIWCECVYVCVYEGLCISFRRGENKPVLIDYDNAIFTKASLDTLCGR